MVFSNFIKSESNNQIVFKNKASINNVGSVKFFEDNASGSFSKKEFRWSFNDNYWASWEILNQGNISNISINGNPCLYLEIRYVKASPTSNVTSFSINYEQAKATQSIKTENVKIEQLITCKDDCKDDACNVGKTTLFNADLLNGQPGSFYLWRPNHQGEQPIGSITGLQTILNNMSSAINNGALNVDGPGVGVYFDKINQVLYFKQLVEGNKIFITDDASGHITISMDDASIVDLYNIKTDKSHSLIQDTSILLNESSINQAFVYIGAINGVNVGGAPGEIFKQRNGNDFEFRTIAAGNSNVVVTTIGDQVLISLDASASGESVWSDPDPISADVGGFNPGDDISVGANSISILEKMLYEYFPPNVNLYLNPSSGYYQKWVDAPEVSIYGNFNNDKFIKAKIYDASIFINGNGDPMFPKISYLDVSMGSFLWNDTAPPYGIGWDDVNYLVKIYNKVGIDIMTPVDVSAAIQFVNPYIWGLVDNSINVSNISPSMLYNFISLGNKIIVPRQSNEINFIRDSSIGMKIKFVYAYDASYGDLDSIFDVKNDFNVTTSFDSSIINLILGATPSPIPYKVYIKSHWIDVSTFKLVFNI